MSAGSPGEKTLPGFLIFFDHLPPMASASTGVGFGLLIKRFSAVATLRRGAEVSRSGSRTFRDEKRRYCLIALTGGDLRAAISTFSMAHPHLWQSLQFHQLAHLPNL